MTITKEQVMTLADAYAMVVYQTKNPDSEEADVARAALVAEIERVERDAARLDWMEKNCLDHNFGEPFFLFEADGKDIRAAIDAMKEQTL